MEHINEYASKGVGNTALGLGIGALGLQALGGGLGGLFGNNCCPDNMPINRYEAGQQARIAELETEVKLRDANTYTDGKLLEFYKYVDRKFAGVDAQLCQQNVVNAQITANISCMQNTINTLTALTKTVVPIDNICPRPMAQFNSWVAPTTETTTTTP